MKEKMKALMLISGLICLGAAVLSAAGMLSQLIMVSAIIIFFPLFVLSTFLAWKASDHEGDYPFIGY